MAKRNVDDFNAIPRKSESYLTKVGKEQLFTIFSKYIHAIVKYHLSKGNETKELEELEETLKEMLDAIIIRVEPE